MYLSKKVNASERNPKRLWKRRASVSGEQPERVHPLRMLVLIASMGLWLSFVEGCGSLNTYDERSGTAYRSFAWGAYREAAISYERAARDAGRGEQILWQLEAAKAWQAAGEYENSREWFERAEATLRQFESEATVVGRDIVREGAQLLTNPGVLAYKGTYTDRILLNTYQALNYLALGRIEGAAVETRRALQRQKKARETYRDEIARIQRKGANTWKQTDSDDNINVPQKGDSLARSYSKVDHAITSPASRFINPFASVLRASVHHMRGDLEQARSELERLRKSDYKHTDIIRYEKQLNKELERGTDPYRPNWCFVVFENGRGPTLREERISLILPKLGYTTVSLPSLKFRPLPYSQIQVETSGAEPKRLTMLTSVDALFGAEFKALFPSILARTAANYLTKEVASRAVVNQADDDTEKYLAFLATGLYKFATGRSDTRTWQSRGNGFYFKAFPIHQETSVTIDASRADGGPTEPVSVQSKKDKHLFIYIQGHTPQKLIWSASYF